MVKTINEYESIFLQTSKKIGIGNYINISYD
jgi:hypothetical protein